jgi:hypothetical protein
MPKRYEKLQRIHTKKFVLQKEYLIPFLLIIYVPCCPGSMLATRSKVHGFKPGQGQWILRVVKTHSTTSFRGEVKLSVPCCKFIACQRTLQA